VYLKNKTRQKKISIFKKFTTPERQTPEIQTPERQTPEIMKYFFE